MEEVATRSRHQASNERLRGRSRTLVVGSEVAGSYSAMIGVRVTLLAQRRLLHDALAGMTQA